MNVQRMSSRRRRRQRGVSIIVVLLMLVVVSVVALAAARLALLGERGSRADRDRDVAFQSAENALLDAQRDIEGQTVGAPASVRGIKFCPTSREGFEAGCGTTSASLGLCDPAADGTQPVWLTAFNDANVATRTVQYGTYTGQNFVSAAGLGTFAAASLPSQPPRYVIEVYADKQFDPNVARAAGGGDQTYFYQITAVGYGMNAATQVMLQETYRAQSSCS